MDNWALWNWTVQKLKGPSINFDPFFSILLDHKLEFFRNNQSGRLRSVKEDGRQVLKSSNFGTVHFDIIQSFTLGIFASISFVNRPL